MKNILLFLCSGTSSRFNGKTKALAKISGSETVIEFNLKNASEFDQVYIVANETNYSEFEKLNLENVKLIKIKTGNGDADSLLNALKELQKVQKLEDFENTSLTFCWGDTVFLNDTIFKKLIKENSEYLNFGFIEVYDHPIILEDFWIVSHEPMYVTLSSPYANIFAHVHSDPKYHTCTSRSYCTCIDRHGFEPVSFTYIKNCVKSYKHISC